MKSGERRFVQCGYIGEKEQIESSGKHFTLPQTQFAVLIGGLGLNRRQEVVVGITKQRWSRCGPTHHCLSPVSPDRLPDEMLEPCEICV